MAACDSNGAVGSALIYLILAAPWLPRYGALTHQFGFGIGVGGFVLGGIAGQLLLTSPGCLGRAAAGADAAVV